MSIARIFEIGKRSLLAYQSAIDTTSGNIANVNKEGYTRRRVDLSNLSAGIPGLGKIGFGVNIEEVTRIRQRMIDNQLYQENQHLGRYETGEMILTQLESIFDESSGAGLTNAISEFWNSWNDLANDPESQANRTIVKDKGRVLADTFNRIHSDLQGMQRDLGSEIESKVDNINQIINQIADINQQIKLNGSLDLKDERDILITSLSELVNIDVKEKENGQVVISTSGLILVSENEVNELNTIVTKDDEYNSITVKLKNIDHDVEIQSGQLFSLLEVHNQRIPNNIDQLNALAKSIADNVNRIHASGYNLDNITGIKFFDENVNGASDFKINTAILKDPGLIASKKSLTGQGDGDLAMSIANLQHETLIDGQSATEYYTSMLSAIGSELQQTELMRGSQQMIVDQIRNQKESVSGVSLDEEMTKLIQYEQAYEAAVRVINTVDEMMETLLAMR